MRSSTVRTSVLAAAVIIASVWTAQDRAKAADAGTVPADAQQAAGLEEIVITAERRSESIQRSSLAIEVFSGAALQDYGVYQTRDLTKLTPGVVIGQGGPATQIYIRGVGDFTSTPITNPAVAVNVDGVYVARSQSIDGNFYDIERVEVLKGPQGTLYGRNASGGAINIITNKPQLGSTTADVETEFGDYGEVNASADANLPVGDTLAVRVAAQLVRRDGYATQGLDDDHHESGRVHALWVPSDAFSLLFSGDYSHIGGLGPAYVFKGVDPTLAATLSAEGVALPSNLRSNGTDPAFQALIFGIGEALGRCIPNGALASARTSAGPAPITGAPQGLCNVGQSSLLSPPGNSLFGAQAGQDNRFWNTSLELNWKLDFATLTVIPAFRHVDNEYVTYPLVTYNDSVGRPELSESKSLETRLGNDGDRVKWTAGLYYFNEDQAADTGSNGGLIIGESLNDYQLTTKSAAAFGQATFSVTDAFRLIGGARLTSDHKTIDGENLTQYPGLPFIANQPCFAKPNPCLRDTFIGDRTFNSPTFKVGAEYDLGPKNMVFLTVATGNKSGGFNPASIAGSANAASSYSPEKLTAYELGSRNRYFDDRVELNVESFYWKYKDSQQFFSTLNASGNTVNELANAGAATIYGLDIDLALRLTPEDTVHAGVEWMHSRFDQFTYQSAGALQDITTGCTVTAGTPFPNIDCTGKPLPRAPDYSGTASYVHTFELPGNQKIEATLAGEFSASRYLTVDFTQASNAAAYVMGDASLAYVNPHRWDVTGFVRNFNNATVYTGAYTLPSLFRSLTLANVGAPRTYGIRLAAHF
jgi:iron complex outermembrane recepter protein